MKMYSVQAMMSWATGKRYCRTVQIPTFYLDPKVQGIVSVEHAERIVQGMLNPMKKPHVTILPNVELIDMNTEE
jgi:hypothetical protein